MEINKVVVLLSTYNGEKYLEEQLRSIYSQTMKDFKVFVRDDGSTDNTQNILKKWDENENFSWYQGENIGPGKSFMELVYNSPEGRYYAFADQDDIWLENKLQKGIDILTGVEENKVALYHSNYYIVNDELQHVGKGPILKNNYIESGLFQNKAIGCSIIFNNILRSKLLLLKNEDIFIHDAWVFRVALLTGNLYFDRDCTFLYRQHSNNVVGLKSSYFEKTLSRLKRKNLLNGQKVATAIQVLEALQEKGLIDEYYLYKHLKKYKYNIYSKIKILSNFKIKFESPADTLFFKLLILFNRA